MKKNYENACGVACFLLLGCMVAYVVFHLQTWTGALNDGLIGAAGQLPWK